MIGTTQQAPVASAPAARLEVRRAHPLDVWAHCARLLTSERLHRRIPDPLMRRLARAAGRARWLWPPARRRAIGRVSLTVAGTEREKDTIALAREELVIRTLHSCFIWRPWIAANTPLLGRDTLDAALASGRPVILASVHLTGDCVSVLAEHGYRDIATVSGPWLFPADGMLPAGFLGYKVLAFRRRTEETGTRLIPAGGTYELLRALLADGVTLMLMADLAGTVRTRMAGKVAHLRGGLARLACEADALVVPVVAPVARGGASVRVLEPVDPRMADGPQEVLDRLGAIFGQVMVDHAASVEPLGHTRGIWREDGESYPIELWRTPGLRDRAVAVRRLLRRHARARAVERGAVDVADRGVAGQAERDVDVGPDHLEDVADARLAAGGDGPGPGASEQHRAGAEREHLHDV